MHIFCAVLGAVVKSIAPGRPQRYMEHGPVFSVVDVFAGEHARAEIFHAGLARQRIKQAQGLCSDPLPGEIQTNARRVDHEMLAARRIAGEQIAQMHRRDLLLMRLERAPGRQIGSRPGRVVHRVCSPELAEKTNPDADSGQLRLTQTVFAPSYCINQSTKRFTPSSTGVTGR